MTEEASGSSSAGGVPFHLMPLAAIFGTYFILACMNLLYIVYRNLTYKKDSTSIPPTPIKSRKVAILVVSIIASVVAYGFIVGQVEKALLEDSFANTVFDPYDILAIPPSSETSEVKQAFRALSKVHHPDKGGDERVFHTITLAYKALTDPVAMRNYEQFGHPDGKPSSPTLNFALPEWLLHPKGKVALFLLLMYLGLFVAIIVYVLTYVKKTEEKRKQHFAKNSVAGEDIQYLATKLGPDSTHWEILYYIATTPESIQMTANGMEKIEQIRANKLAKIKKEEEESKKGNLIALDDDGGWASDDDNQTEEEKAAAEAYKKQEQDELKRKEKLNSTMGKEVDPSSIMLEGIDKDVIGQEWVQSKLEALKVWPPKLPKDAGTFKDEKTGKVVGPLEHPAVKKNILMTMGRLNSVVLNTHPEIIKASASGKIDPTYFRSTMEFRQRNGLLLESALRVANSSCSYRLAKTVVETVAMFKIGTTNATNEKNINHFRSNMMKIYGGPDGIPNIQLKLESLNTPGEEEMATGDKLEMKVAFQRSHADKFTKQKLMMAKKQNIPPQLALQTFNEIWWVLVRAERVGADENAKAQPTDALSKLISDPSQMKKYEDEPEKYHLLLAFPFIIKNIATKDGLAQIVFKAPQIPGTYNIFVDFMSADFLGCNKELYLKDIKILDVEEVKRKQEEEDKEDENSVEEEGDEGEEDDDENKKTK